MWPIFSFARWRTALIVIVIAIVSIVFLAYSGTVVKANWTEKRVSLDAQQVSSEGWNNPELALSNDLASDAPFLLFTEENAASVILAGIVSQEPELAPEPEPEPGPATTTESNPDALATTTPETASSTLQVPSDVEPDEMTPEESETVVPPAVATTTPPEDMATTTEEAPTSLMQLRNMFGTTVFADSQSGDVALCIIDGTECHTIEFSGFELDDELLGKRFETAELKFSFASAQTEGDTDDKLLIRYFADGGWHEAGELYLNKEHSNAANGAYFTAALTDIDEWSDLDGLRVVIEYDRASPEHDAHALLDAVWIDAVYKDRPQDFEADEIAETLAEIPDAIADIFSGEEAVPQAGTLIIPGDMLTFTFTDDVNEDTLTMRAHAPVRQGSDEPVYISVTNDGEQPDAFTLFIAARDGDPVREIAQFVHNVPRVQSASSSYSNVEYVSDWVAVPLVGADTPSNVPDGLAVKAMTEKQFEISPGQTLYFRVGLNAGAGDTRFAIMAEGSQKGDLDFGALGDETELRSAFDETVAKERLLVNDRLSARTNFDGDEMPEFRFKFKSQRNVLLRAINWLLRRDAQFAIDEARLRNAAGEEETVLVDVEYGENNEWTMRLKEVPRAFRPGKYSIDILIEEGGSTYVETVEFYWGVLVANTDKSIYAPGETAHIMMAALDETGDTICDADLELTVASPDGTLHSIPVEESGNCGPNNVVDTADYLADYETDVAGTYTISLMRFEGSTLIHRVTDAFQVRERAPFSIARKGATRIYPAADYRMRITLTANLDFNGEFVEAVPLDFLLPDAGSATIEMWGGAKRLVWPVALRAGESVTFEYEYDAPDISPYLYLLGPAEVRSGDAQPFVEAREWKLASDATGNMLLFWDRTYIPTGWTCVSCLPSDPFYQRFVVGSSTAGVNGGATTHTHTATGVVNASTGSQGVDTNNQATPTVGHTHTYTPTIGTASNLPPYRHLSIIQFNSTGEPTQIPAGAIAIFDVASSSLPSGWTRYPNQDGRFIRSEATSTVGTNGGASTHTHAISGSTGAAATTVNVRNPGTSVTVAAAAHTHTVSGTTGSATNTPPYIEVLLGRLMSTTTPTNSMIAMWSADPYTGWNTVSSSSEPFVNRFLLASTTYSGTGGSATSTHANVTGITSGAPSATIARDSTPVNTTVASQAHTHSVDVTNFSTDDHQPPYRTAVFAKRAGGAPPQGPTVHTLFESEKTGTSTPRLEFTGSDPDGTDTLIYQVQWDDDADLDTSPVGDRTSSNESGCSPNCFENTTDGADTSPFDEAERIRFTIQTALVSGTTYYWRVRAQETNSSVWGSWSTTTSFTYVANTDPSQWFQSQDAQFDTGTLDNVETFGSDSIRINVADPVEALIAYAEGVVQTPRYRLWDGDSWGAEGSAQSVGGTIQWTTVRAGTTRNEYVLGTQDAANDVNVQVYDADAGTWGDLQEVTTAVSDNTARGFDIAYESTSGDAIAVYCDGDADPSYYVWNGTNWTSGGTINIGSANACEWIKLASDPASDEIILVERDTGIVYEAQVWNGSSWSNGVTLGSMTDTLHEGIAVEYEESGNQALVVVSNGGAASFAWVAWDGTQWSTQTTQTLGDDFESGVLKRDSGSDNMALCYADQDDDLGIVRWDGSGWQTNQEFEANANIGAGGLVDGRPVSCEFEVSAGRDGYLMIPYSDTAAARYNFWNGSAFNGENSISTIQDSWTVSSARTGEGKILAVFHDDVNTQYDFSYWDGASWSTIDTLETSTSIAAEPFREPVAMAAKVYQPASGSIMSDPISFSQVPNQMTWGEVLWDTTEPSGTDVKIQVYHGASCTTLVPDNQFSNAANYGLNSVGFDATTTPLNISGLSTTTYSTLCLKATLSSASQNNPTLDDWALTWERQPYFTQQDYRWYANLTSLTPTDAWPSGATDLVENDAITASYAPIFGNVLRLRMNVLTENVGLSAGALALRLQYAVGSTCDADSQWFDVGATGSTTAAWRGYDNSGLTDGTTLPSTLLTNSDIRGTYEESNDSVTNPNGASANQETEWDWTLEHRAAAGITYCFRAISSGGVPLNEYDRYATLVTNVEPSAPLLDKPFDNEQLASTTPWFEFAAEDPEANDITYQIQIDDTYDFSSTVVDINSQTNFNDFTNLVTPSDKDPFNSGQSVRYIPTSALSNNTTYYWRVRAKDRNASTEWSDWSEVHSVTVDTSTVVSTWFQTRMEQFDTNTQEDTEATTSPAHDTILVPGFTSGTTTSTSIDFDWHSTGNAWNELSWTDNETSSDIKYHIEYLSGDTWSLIPDSDLGGNAAGFDTSPISLLSLSPTTYNEIRLRANLTNSGATPRLNDWTVEWGFAVEQPTQVALFDNEKAGTTTPTFKFYSTDPQSNDLEYEISISQTTDFAASTTRRSGAHAGFTNTASSTDLTPFNDGDTIQFKLQQADALTNGNTYWWRVRARDVNGANVWSTWSELRSFTIDTTVVVSTWFQTTDEQFATDELNDTETTGSDSVQITSIIREALVAYAEGTTQVPRFRIWNGSSWGNEGSGVSVGNTIRFVELDANPARDEYIAGTMTAAGKVQAQILNGTTDTWGNLADVVTAVSDATQRGFDVAYETDSGDALAVSCNGTEAMYRIWNGSSWGATTTLNLAVSGNCEWIRLASDPASDEIILVARDATAGAVDYEAMVWNGSSWGNSTAFGSQVTANNEGIAVEYEESGGQAIVVVANGANNNFIWNAWNGSGWAGTNTVAIGNDFAGGRLKSDLGSDSMAFCYIDIDADIGFARWNGSSWSASSELELTGNSANGRPVTCEYETTAGRDGYIMIPYSDTIQAEYQFWDTSILNGPTVLTTITDSWEMRSARTGDGNILVVAYDDANTEYDFTFWNGSTWSTEQQLEATSITTVAPATIPIDIVARRFPSFTSGNVVSTPVDFDDGIAPKWEEVAWTDLTPGTSNILYQVEYFTSTSSWAVIPDVDLPGNVAGTTTSPIDIGDLNRTTYNVIRLKANLACSAGDCPTLSDWTIEWSEGVNISGTAQAYNQSTNLTSGTVGVAVNGTLQTGKTATIQANGTWTIPNVTVFTDDVITVFIDGAGEEGEAVAITKYDGVGDVTGIPLYQRHLTIGSNDNQTITNANISQYDSSVSGDEDVFHDVDGGNDLTVCAVAGCDAEIYIKSGNTYQPDSSSSGNVTTHDIEIDGTLTGDGNTITLYGSWDNDGTWNANSSTVVMAATSSTETIDSGTSGTRAFNNLTVGSGSGNATTTLANALDVDGTLTVNFGTLSPSARPITIAGNLTFGANGVFQKGTASTTFDGSGSSTWTDSTSAKQDLGDLIVNGTSKTVQLASGAKATHITIGADDIFNLGGSNNLTVTGNWTNNNSFIPQTGTVTFATSSTGMTITPGNSSFYNITFNGSGGNWAFSGGTVSATNDFTITAGTVTMPTATTTVGGNFEVNGGTFMHNNGIVLLNSSATKTVRPGSNNLYDVVFNGSGSWSFTDTHATSSHNVTITSGTVTAPSGTFAIAGNYAKNGGTFTHNSGALRFTSSGAQTVRLGGSDAFDLLFAGSGSWSFVDTNATTTNTTRFLNGATTLPSGTFAVGGSWLVTSGSFTHNNGVVRFNSTDSGETIAPNGSWFRDLYFAGTGGWTIMQNATSTGNTTIASAGNFTLQSGNILAVSGSFTNLVGGLATSWTSSTLYLNSGTSYAINTKSIGGDMYGTLAIATNTDVKTWNSAATTTTVSSSGSLYSQDHAAQDGDLYIWGEYISMSNEYWSYATDFDGTALGVSSRQVDVRVAPNASISFGSSTLQVLGASTATTTIANQGSGTYGLHVSGGALNAQYYSFAHTDTRGLWLSGSTTITSLADGYFDLTTEGGSSLTVEPSVIDGNPALQIQRVQFDESITAGSNVTATSSPTSYWWFRNHYGNFDGEAFDTDPGGDPGNIRWDDSGFSITVSGNVYADHGNTVSSVCDNSTPVVRIVVNGGNSYTGSCNSGTGAYSIPGVSFTGDPVFTAYLDTNGGRRAVTVTKTPTADIAGLNLYERALIVRHENVTPLTIANLAVYDQSDDTDLFFTAATGSPDTLSVNAEHELFVWGGKTFAPGGNVSVLGGGSGAAYDGTFTIAANGVFTAVGTESHSIGGSFLAASGSTFTAASSTLTFTATTSGKTINASSTLTLWNTTFNGTGGNWSLTSPATTTVQNTLSISAGTLSGSGNVSVRTGGASGNGVIAMSSGTFEFIGTGNIGGSSEWLFNNLFIGNGSTTAITKTGNGTTTVASKLRIASSGTLLAGSSPWVLSGSGRPFVIVGTFTVQSAPWYYTATAATEIADTTYGALTFAPSVAGTPTYTILGGTLTADDLTVGGANPVSVTINTNDPTVLVTDDVVINSGSTLIASNVGAFEISGSWTNFGTFTHSNGSVLFESADGGETVTAGSSSFYDVEFTNGGGWTVTQNATTTHDLDLTSASGFTVSSGVTLAVGGTFTNLVGGGSTVWTGSTLALKSGTSYTINTKAAGDDTYGTLSVMSGTDVSMWHSSADSILVEPTASLYSQDHANVDGDLYIWGSYERATGSDYWSYSTDFDGSSLGVGARQVDVRIASSSTITLSGGVLDIIGASDATTTVAVQGTGAYNVAVTGGTLNANYYSFRNLTAGGLTLTGSPTITSLSNGDYELAINGGSLLTVAGSVIDANPLKIITYNRFGTSTGITAGTNVTATGSSNSSWKYNLHYGDIDGEAYDSDPGGDPGFIRWDDSASQITIAGNVYSDEGSTVSSVCNGSTQVVRLRVAGTSAGFVSCDAGTGAYSIPNVSYNPGDSFIVYLDTNGGRRAANVSVDPNTNIANMHLYENRVIVRHEDTTPLNIVDMTTYDSDQDPDINFDAEDAATDTLALPAENKLIVWTQKTFAPAGNITLNSGGSGNAWDGTLELYATSTLSTAGAQAHAVGGSLVLQNGATIDSANSTFTFTATTTGKTIAPQNASFYNIVFNGSGGNWAFSGGAATSTNDFTISAGTVTLPTGTTTIGGSFQNTAGTFMHNNGTIYFTSTASGKSVRGNGSNFYNLTFNGTGGGWTFMDTNATSSQNVIIANGSVTAPTGALAVGASFLNSGTYTHSSGTLRLTSSATGRTLHTGNSTFYNVLFGGTGDWTWNDVGATTTNDVSITVGSTTLPQSLAVGGSFVNGGTFNHANGIVRFTATATGKNITASTSPFSAVIFEGASGGWTMTGNATSTSHFTLGSASFFKVASGATLSVGGIFTNNVAGSATDWSGSQLSLIGTTTYGINTKSNSGDRYQTLYIGPNLDVTMWNSSATTTTVHASGSLYSQDHAAQDGDLYIWGDYQITSGTQYWSYATDFDGTALGSPRAVDVRLASSTTVTMSGGALNIVGSTGSATSTIANQGSGRYSFAISGGTLNAQYYRFQHLDGSGLNLSGAPSITSINDGDFELDMPGGTTITAAATVIDANASMVITGMRFATSSGVGSGFNVTRTGSPVAAWTFTGHTGSIDGEAFDVDGGDGCGQIRWSDSSCLFVSQSHFRWREDDGGEGAPSSEWFNASWTKRTRVGVTNNTVSSYTNVPVRMVVDYDGDMQSDFDDLRFTDSSGTTSISYYIESTIASASSTVWVEIPSLPASDDTYIYMYYGNAGASSGSDGSNTFAFFDDFEDDNISEYSGDTSLFDVDTQFNRFNSFGLDAGSNVEEQTTSGIRRTGTLTQQGQTIRYYQYVDPSFDDEPCTLFAVGGAGTNYAVCLDQYPDERVVIAEDVDSNDGSGTSIASTTVDYDANGSMWYEVVIDWVGTTITVNVYDATGALFATVQGTDGTRSSGGMGFSFWAQHGGWDYYTSRTYVATAPTVVFGAEGANSGATWKAAEDTALSGQQTNENVRLRFSIQNTGGPLTNQLYGLQYAPKGASLNCESVPHVNFAAVPVAASCGSAPACMTTSSQFTNQSATAGLLSYPGILSFAPGQIIEDPSNETSAMNVGTNAATEVEYNFQLTDNATQNAYCFRVAEDGDSLDNYDKVAEIIMSHSPVISNFSLNDSQDMILIEGATTTIQATSTVSDQNGYADIVSATSTIYRSGVGPMCSANNNSCYQIASSSCSFTDCSGSSCTLVCSADVQYFADPTDASSTYAGENWLARVQVEDDSGKMDVETSFGVELLTLYALSIEQNIDFGSLSVGQNTGATNATTTIVNTGNANIDIQLAGTDLTGGASSIAVGEQKFATTTFAYSGCAICQFLTGSAANVEVDLPKPTSTSSPVSDDVYWGINVPTGTGATTFTGTNTFWAIGD